MMVKRGFYFQLILKGYGDSIILCVILILLYLSFRSTGNIYSFDYRLICMPQFVAPYLPLPN